MSRRKKSRKIGQLAPRKTDTPKPVKEKRLFVKKRKGLKAGTRNTDEDNQLTGIGSGQTNQNDPRVGSKKPIDLHATTKTTQGPEPVAEKPLPDTKPKAKLVNESNDDAQIKQWQQELAKLEQDQELQDLLERYENDESLSPQQLAKINKMTARHADLLEKLGIDSDFEDDEDLYDAWQNSEQGKDW
ncbi:Der GTPase-activating protein YihI [Saccharobesus litoralis]|nr:Der GTPase-activating protein YihI [Saccharobesus litoralis]